MLVNVVFLLCSTAVTLALPTADCVASRTVPAIEPETVCPNPYADRRITANNAATNFVGRITTPLVVFLWRVQTAKTMPPVTPELRGVYSRRRIIANSN